MRIPTITPLRTITARTATCTARTASTTTERTGRALKAAARTVMSTQ
jgi:hypothetical protein